MSPVLPTKPGNRLLNDLTPAARERVIALGEEVDLEFGTKVCEANRRFRYVYFPLTGFISLVHTVGKHPPLEMGLIGSEGMLGVTAILGITIAPLSAVVQGPGRALRLTTSALRIEMDAHPPLREALQRYLYVLFMQLAQTTACTRFHEIDARLSRWLLMTHDRAHGDRFHLTHQFLADMLGVQRSAVTIAAGVLQARGLISYTRGEILIVDRRGLEAASCECYEAVVADYARFFPAKSTRPTSGG